MAVPTANSADCADSADSSWDGRSWMLTLAEAITKALLFADALSRERLLSSEETDALEPLVYTDELLKRRPADVMERQRRWSREDDQRLQDMRRDDLPAPTIAAHLNRSAWSVRSRVRTLRRHSLKIGSDGA